MNIGAIGSIIVGLLSADSKRVKFLGAVLSGAALLVAVIFLYSIPCAWLAHSVGEYTECLDCVMESVGHFALDSIGS